MEYRKKIEFAGIKHRWRCGGRWKWSRGRESEEERIGILGGNDYIREEDKMENKLVVPACGFMSCLPSCRFDPGNAGMSFGDQSLRLNLLLKIDVKSIQCVLFLRRTYSKSQVFLKIVLVAWTSLSSPTKSLPCLQTCTTAHQKCSRGYLLVPCLQLIYT